MLMDGRGLAGITNANCIHDDAHLHVLLADCKCLPEKGCHASGLVISSSMQMGCHKTQYII